MINYFELTLNYLGYFRVIRTIAIVIATYFIFSLILKIVKNHLKKKIKTKKQLSSLEIFTKVIKYVFLIFLVSIAFSSYANSWAGIGIGVGFFSAALGWALQRPITGMAAWIMVVTKRPFELGDRVIIGDTKGDVSDITLSHIHLKEVGGTIASEENSGRIIMVPNSLLFEQKIINYTMQDDYILDEAITLVTYESDLEKAKKICYESALKNIDESLKEKNILPFVRVFQGGSGIDVKVRYNARANDRIELLSRIHNDIITTIAKTKGVQIAYPHIQIVRDR